jgi:hypothetical protein
MNNLTKNLYQILFVTAKGMRPFGTQTQCLEIDIKGTKCGDMDWIQLAQDKTKLKAHVITIPNFHVP